MKVTKKDTGQLGLEEGERPRGGELGTGRRDTVAGGREAVCEPAAKTRRKAGFVLVGMWGASVF